MREVRIKTSKNHSDYITSGNSSLGLLLETYKIKKCFVITDDIVYELHKNYLEIFKNKLIGIKVIRNGELSKNLDDVMDIYQELIKSEANRKTHIIALGGGVVGDLAGFAAATFMRGLPLVHIPTTLMSQCDSSIGGKNGFNFKNYKNIIGTFHQPDFIYSDVNFLKTLNDREYKNGIAEVIKYGLTCDINLFHFLEENRRGIVEREVDKLLYIVNECARIKGSIIEKDEYDRGLRNILNFGHTIGHGIESSAGFSLSHGEAVALGMKAEAFIAVRSGYFEEKYYNRAMNLIRDFGLPQSLKNVDTREVIEYMKRDKKNTTNNVKFVLPDKIGHAIITTEIKQNLIAEAMEELTRR